MEVRHWFSFISVQTFVSHAGLKPSTFYFCCCLSSLRASYLATQFWRWILRGLFRVCVSDYMKSMSWCRRAVVEGHIIEIGNCWGAGKENGEGRGRGEVSLQATWDQSGQGSHHMQRRNSKLVRGTQEQGRDSLGRGAITKGIVKGLSGGLCHVLLIMSTLYTSCYCVYVVLIKELCLGYK
jgi:hypothetical protein